MLLDRILVAHTKHLSVDDREQPPDVYELDVSSMRARLKLDGDSPSQPVVDCTVRGVSAGLTLRSRPEGHDLDLNAAVHHFTVCLCAERPDTRLDACDDPSLPGPVVARVLSEGLEAGLEWRKTRKCVVLRSAVLATTIVTPAFAHIATLAETWQKQAQATGRSAAKRHSPTAMVMYQTVRAALEQRQTLVQPPFAYESGYGLHVSDQRNIRLDLGWGIMSRVRHWRQVLLVARDVPHANIIDYTVASLLSVEDWATGTEGFIRSQLCMKLAFGDNIERQNDALPKLPNLDVHVFVNLDVLQVAHEGRTLESDAVETSRVKLVSISFGLRHRKLHDVDRVVNQIRSINTVKGIEVEIRNNVFLAIDPMLALVPSRAPASPPAQPRGYASENDGREKWSIAVDNHVARGDIHVIGAGLRLSAGIADGSVNVKARTDQIGPRTRPIATRRCNALARLKGISLTLSALEQSNDLLSLPNDRVISHSQAEELKIVLDHREGATPEVKALLRLALSLGHFAFDVRPQIKSLASFGVAWKKEHYP